MVLMLSQRCELSAGRPRERSAARRASQHRFLPPVIREGGRRGHCGSCDSGSGSMISGLSSGAVSPLRSASSRSNSCSIARAIQALAGASPFTRFSAAPFPESTSPQIALFVA